METANDAGRVAGLVGLLFGLTGMGSAAVAVTLPAISVDLGLSTGGSAWIISLYILMLAVATAVYGRVADLVGIRLPLTVGVVLMAAGAALGALAPTYPVLLTARVLQGAGAASVPVLGVAIVSAKYAGVVRTVALGRVAGTAAAVTALGPLAGGGVADLLSWRAVVALPALGLLVLPWLWRATPTAGSGARLDLLGAVLVGFTAAGLVLLVQSPSSGIVVALAGALLLALGVPSVVARVRRRPQGFLPLLVIRNGTVVRSALAASAVPAAWFALLIAIPVVLVSLGWSPLQVGLALIPSAATGILAPKLAAPVLVRLGAARSLAVAGSLAAFALVVAAGGASLGTPAAAAPVLVLAAMLVSVSFGLGQPALMAAVSDAVPPDVRGVALGIATLVFLVGGGVGSAVVGGLAEVLGMRTALLLLVLLPVAGVLVVLPRRTPVPA